jgi:hypothetical protein
MCDVGRWDVFISVHSQKIFHIYSFNKITGISTDIQNPNSYIIRYIVAYLLKAGTVEPQKQPFIGNGYVTCKSEVTACSDVFYAVRAEAI